MESRALLDYYVCPAEYTRFEVGLTEPSTSGYFRLGADTTCYGRASGGAVSEEPAGDFHDAMSGVRRESSGCYLPFDPDEVLGNLRMERYAATPASGRSGGLLKSAVRGAYYMVRPLMPVSIRRHLQKAYLRGWESIPFPEWPVDCSVERIAKTLLGLSMECHGVGNCPFVWFWPERKNGCLILTHDVETSLGRDFCGQLMDIDESFGIKSSFQIIPEQRYEVTDSFLDSIRGRGFEINVHGLNHDGHLFDDRKEFLRRAGLINGYAKKFGATGFRSPVLYRNLDWYDAFDFSYDMSVPNVGHLDPQRGGCCTVMPYFVGEILELPLTTVQDYSLFNVMGDYSIDLWKKQITWILDEFGMVSLNIHPDYVVDVKALDVYKRLLEHICAIREERDIWVALPREVDEWWRSRSRMRVNDADGYWAIEGDGSERACIARAILESGALTYAVEARG